MIWCGNSCTLVFNGDPTQWIVLALRVPHPVIWHLNSRKRRMPVKNYAEKVQVSRSCQSTDGYSAEPPLMLYCISLSVC